MFPAAEGSSDIRQNLAAITCSVLKTLFCHFSKYVVAAMLCLRKDLKEITTITNIESAQPLQLCYLTSNSQHAPQKSSPSSICTSFNYKQAHLF